MALSPMRTLGTLRRATSPLHSTVRKESTFIKGVFSNTYYRSPLDSRSMKSWPKVDFTYPLHNFKDDKHEGTYYHRVKSEKNLHQLHKQSIAEQKEKNGLQESPEAVSLNTPDRFRLNNIISKRKKKCYIGKGGFGTVLKGSYKGKNLAVKVVPKINVFSLENEANALHINHSNIIKVFKIIVEKEYGLIFMEINFGPNVHELLHESCAYIKASDRIRYMLNVAQALEYCHHLRILHLDVKPKNILLSVQTNTCKLCDFGCSVCIDDLNLHHLKKENIGINTVSYTDPQLLKGNLPSCKSDVYSFAITMWQLLSQEVPYEGIDCHTIIYNVVSTNYRPKEMVPKTSFDQRYIKLYQMCWLPQPALRPAMPFVSNELNEMLHEEMKEKEALGFKNNNSMSIT